MEIIRYNNIDELLNIHSTSIVIWNHFNKFQEVPQKLFIKNIILIEDFVHAPFDMIKAKAKYSINSDIITYGFNHDFLPSFLIFDTNLFISQ